MNTLTPSLIVKNATQALRFYEDIFGAKLEREPLRGPQGKILHVDLRIGKSRFSLADEAPEFGNLGPTSIGGSPVRLAVQVDDPDLTAAMAEAAGASIDIPIADQFYGVRSGRIVDPFGHVWILEKHIEDISPEEMQRRADELFGAEK